MNIDNSSHHKPFGRVDTTIGAMSVFEVTARDQKALHKELGKLIEQFPSSEYVRALAKYVCYPTDKLREGNYKPSEPMLTNAQLESLSEGDLEAFSEIYVKNNDYLYREMKSFNKTNAGGRTSASIEYGEVIHPKRDDENYTQYLHRLSILEEQEEVKWAEQFRNSLPGMNWAEQLRNLLPGINSFSPTLSANIMKTLNIGNSLNRAIERIKPAHTGLFPPPIPKGVSPDIMMLKDEHLIVPLKTIGSKLDKLVDLSAQSSQFIVKANEIQTGIAGEIKKSSDSTSWFSKWNIKLTIVVILLSVCSLVSSVYVILRDRNIQTAGQKQLKEVTQSIRTDLAALSDALHDLHGAKVKQDTALMDALRNSTKETNPYLKELVQIESKIASHLAATEKQGQENTQSIVQELRNLSAVITNMPTKPNNGLESTGETLGRSPAAQP